MTWKCINRKIAMDKFTHFIFLRNKQIAIADHSMKNTHDPASSDDGLLIVNGRVTEEMYGAMFYYTIPLRSINNPDEKYSTVTSFDVACMINGLLDFPNVSGEDFE